MDYDGPYTSISNLWKVLLSCTVTSPKSLEDYQVMSYELKQWSSPGSALILSTLGF